MAAAPPGMSVMDLGRPYNARFKPLRSGQGKSLFPEAGEPRKTRQHSASHELVFARSRETLNANASVWFAGASTGYSRSNRYASYRAQQVTAVFQIDDTTPMREPSEEAVYYPWRIFKGRSYESVLSGNASDFHTGVTADLKVFSGSFEAFAEEHNLEWSAHARGLTPKSGNAIFARTQDEIERSYEQSPRPVVILVEWRTIPGRKAPKGKRIAWTKLKKGCAGEPGCEPCSTWSISRLDFAVPRRKSNANAWDADGSAPDVVLTLRGAGRTSKKMETYSAVWQLSPPLRVNSGESLTVEATDADLAAHDHIGTKRVDISPTAKEGRIVGAGGAVTLTGVCVDP